MMMILICFLQFGMILFAPAQSLAQDAFVPTEAERAKISDCIKRAASETELKQMSACIGLIAEPCVEAPDANTASLVACHMREQTIWDGYLNTWYGEAQNKLKGDTASGDALKQAQRAWIAFRDAKCAYWEKRYAGGTIVAVLTGDCMRVETGIRALEVRAILDDLDQ
ncbi:MAG: DUF1311 domain-containing protein [Alphaproteobacteria bacterium]|nr:DUF1311 domain-containing protein [Alphaproteobacteria bacterium]